MSRRHRRILLLFLLFLSSAGNLTALAECLAAHSAALLRLKQGFTFSRSASDLATWRPGTDCCTWEGVTCSAGEVTGLDLSGRSISGEVVVALFDLTSLAALNLAHNLFDPGPFPPSWGFERLGNLTRLNLSDAGFTGQIPAGISRLTKLVSLDLSAFYLDERPNSSLHLEDPDFETLIGDLSDLRELRLDGVNISASGGNWCRALSESVHRLQTLSLVGCSLLGPIDSSLSGLEDLSVLRLDENQLDSVVPDFFGGFSSMSELRLSSCGLQGLFPESVFRLRNLTVVDLSSNPMLYGYLPEFPKDARMQSLILSHTKFSGFLPESIGNLESLTKLQLMNCGFSGTLPSSIGNLTQLMHLDLSNNNFYGTIPSVISWPRIAGVVLAHNSFTGSINSSFGGRRFPNLTKLDLQNNSFSGPIPSSLFSLPALQVLQLSKNKLFGQLEEFLNASSVLGTIDLCENQLQGQIPRSIFSLGGLKILALASNNFSGTVELDLVSGLRNLSSLDLSNNRLSIKDGGGNSSPSFPSIGTLNLASCNLTNIPGFLRHQYKINKLDLSNTRIGGAIPKWIWNIGNTSLTYLNLSCNSFTNVEGPLPEFSLSSSPGIIDLHSNMLGGPIPLPPVNTIVLDYSDNKFNSFIPSNISSYLTYTIFFSMSKNELIGKIPPSICNASYLQVLDISDNNLTGPIPPCLLEGGNELRVLNLKGNQLSGSMPLNVSSRCVLRTININGNRFEGMVPTNLAKCRMLEVLDLGNNHIVDSFPYWLSDLPQLRVLVLRSNEFYGWVGDPLKSHESNCMFPMLQIFDLSSNNFSGNLSSGCFAKMKSMMVGSDVNHSTVGFRYLDFTSQSYYEDKVTVTYKGYDMTLVKILTIFTSIDVSNNKFEGGIPRAIGDLKSLYMLNISHNSLTGSIPQSLGALVQLESLDLSSNHLSGEIPQVLASLTFLSSLNLSNNNLEGRIPQGSQLWTFQNSSYYGNEGLCGIPLSRQCGSNSATPPSELGIESVGQSEEPSWQLVFKGLGFGAGLAIVIGALSVCGDGRKWYNERVDRLLWVMIPVPLVVWVFDWWGDGRVGAEEGEMEEDGGSGRRFCVLCTKLEFCEGRMVIHHVECKCLTEG